MRYLYTLLIIISFNSFSQEDEKIDINVERVNTIQELLEQVQQNKSIYKDDNTKRINDFLDLVNENFSNFSNIFFFMGKSGKEILKKTIKDWDLEYTEKKSLTSEDSFLINVKKIKKKNKNKLKKN